MRLLTLLLCLALPAAASAGSALDRVRQRGVLRCGGAIRPGLAFLDPGGAWHGLEIDLCRAAAVAALGKHARFEFHDYTLQLSSYDGVRSGTDDLSFLTASEMLYAGVLADVLPGPPVFFVTPEVMVPAGSPAQHLADLRDKRICAEPGTGPERSLNAWYQARGIPIRFFMFQESDEMLDAFYAGRCEAIAQEATSLDAIRLQAAADGHDARILPEPLAAAPILAMTPRADADWAAVVSWTVATLLQAERGAAALPLDGKALGLASDWQAAVLDAVGSYGDIYRREIGDGSPLALPRGPNALWPDGLFCPPFSE